MVILNSWVDFLPLAIGLLCIYEVIVWFLFKLKGSASKREKEEIKLDEGDLTTEERIAKLEKLESNSYENIEIRTIDDSTTDYLEEESPVQLNAEEVITEKAGESQDYGVQVEDMAPEEGGEEEVLPEHNETLQESEEIDELEENHSQAIQPVDLCLGTEDGSLKAFWEGSSVLNPDVLGSGNSGSNPNLHQKVVKFEGEEPVVKANGRIFATTSEEENDMDAEMTRYRDESQTLGIQRKSFVKSLGDLEEEDETPNQEEPDE